MTTKKARDFLDKELFVNRSIVTFRSLSRELGIHVNDAKNELQCYHDAVHGTDAQAVPTYLVSGEVPALTVRRPHLDVQQSDSAMDLDLEFEEDQGEVDVVCQSRVLLVDARTLDAAMAQFSRVHSVHVYSLSPARFGDAGLVCTPSYKVQRADAKGGPESFSVVGKVTGPHVKLKDGATIKSTASSSKRTLDIPVKVPPKAEVSVKTEQETTKGKISFTDTKEQGSATAMVPKTESKDRPKPSGKLDWSKAKTKEKEPVAEKTKEDKKPRPEPKSTATTNDVSTSKRPGPEPSVSKSGSSSVTGGGAQKRGIKRKPRVDTDLESGSEPSSARANPGAAGGSSYRKWVVDSDEDEDEDAEAQVRKLGQRRPKRKSAMTSDSEMSLRAMMDVDDERVDRLSRVRNTRPQPEEEESSEPEKEGTAPPATSEGEESDEMVIPLKKRKPRKIIPVGRNGLRKRRVVKRRTTTDAKGYMQTEDYSSYESVEEEEAETKPKGKGRETKKVSDAKGEEANPKVVVKEESVGKPKARSAARPTARGGGPKRGGLLNFFGPEKGKK